MPSIPAVPARTRLRGFTLVEMMVVIAIISVLMTIGAIGIGNIGGKGVSGGVTLAEAVFDEARTTAISRNLRSCVLIAREVRNSPAEDLRRMVVAYEEVDETTGLAKNPDTTTPNWVLSSRAVLLPEQTYFSEKYSKKNFSGTGKIDTIEHSRIKDVKSSWNGSYYIYQFNSQGVCTSSTTPDSTEDLKGVSFVIGSGARNLSQSALQAPPRVTGSAKRDFGGFVIWPNGSTSTFKNPADIDQQIRTIQSGTTF
jgi:prepilin-type N-terminal cleavage/methylation domain-containing protein